MALDEAGTQAFDAERNDLDRCEKEQNRLIAHKLKKHNNLNLIMTMLGVDQKNDETKEATSAASAPTQEPPSKSSSQ